MRTITATVPAWITSECFDPKTLIDGEPIGIISELSFYGNSDMTKCGWVKCGIAEITLTIDNERQVVDQKVKTLEAQKKKIIADAHLQVARVEGKIQELLCLEYKPVEGGAASRGYDG